MHSVISDPAWLGDETLDPRRSLLSERHPGTFAERVAVPARNLVPKPPELSWEQAACLPTAWLTAYRMLFTRGRVVPGMTVLVQGAGGGVATALIALGRAAGLRVWATSRSEEKRARAVALGADATFEPGSRLPERVDAVMETVGPGDLEPFAEVAQARRRARHLGRDQRAEPSGRPQPRVLPAALRDRLDDGHARRARAARAPVRRARRPPGRRADAADGGGPDRLRGARRRRGLRQARADRAERRGPAARPSQVCSRRRADGVRGSLRVGSAVGQAAPMPGSIGPVHPVNIPTVAAVQHPSMWNP